MLRYRIRINEPGDKPFILSSWLRSNRSVKYGRADNHWIADDDEYYRLYGAYAAGELDDGFADMLVFEDQPDEIIGYRVYSKARRPLFTYIKYAYRSLTDTLIQSLEERHEERKQDSPKECDHASAAGA